MTETKRCGECRWWERMPSGWDYCTHEDVNDWRRADAGEDCPHFEARGEAT